MSDNPDGLNRDASGDTIEIGLNELPQQAPSPIQKLAQAVIESIANPGGEGFSGLILTKPGMGARAHVLEALEAANARIAVYFPGDGKGGVVPAEQNRKNMQDLSENTGCVVLVDQLESFSTQEFLEFQNGILENRGRWGVIGIGVEGAAFQPGFQSVASRMDRLIHWNGGMAEPDTDQAAPPAGAKPAQPQIDHGSPLSPALLDRLIVRRAHDEEIPQPAAPQTPKA